jgi:hypothetical protein
MIITSTGQFQHEFKKLIKEEYERLKDNIATGSAVSFEDYQRQIGKIQGLATALEFANDAKDLVDGNKKREL